MFVRQRNMSRWANIGHSVNRWRMASQPNDIAANDMADPPLF
jgi:hypothetical protein